DYYCTLYVGSGIHVF
nr:immunoglobulin light chain junction region [Macaca mulatta]MOW61187.1 immunoglobulin light chain junction region [Macaca mulatta]